MSWLSKEPDPNSRRGQALAKGREREERLRAKSAEQETERIGRKVQAAERETLLFQATNALVPPRKCPACLKRMKTGAWVCHHCGTDHRPADDAPIGGLS